QMKEILKVWKHGSFSIELKLRLIIMATAGATLILALAAVVAIDQLSMRASMRSDLSVLADMLAANSTAALTFNDRGAATELLSGLKTKRSIVAAYLNHAEGEPFASFERNAAWGAMAPPVQADNTWFERGRLK